MKLPEIPANEKLRLKSLEDYNILDTLSEEEYDSITRIAAAICQTPIALISLIDHNRQWFKSHHGLDKVETPRDFSFCAHAINEPDNIFIVPDSRKDQRFYDNPLVIAAPNVIFYAGAPLVNTDGYTLGTLCVIDNKPSVLNKEQHSALASLSKQVVALLELKKNKAFLNKANSELAAKNKTLEEFARIAAHDIKSPLNNISSLVEFLKPQISKLDKDGKVLFDMIGKSANELRHLIEGILNYSLGDQLLTAQKESIDFNSFIQSIIDLIDSAKEHQFILPQKNLNVFANKVALKQLFINLIVNAIKYNDKEKVVIEIGVTATEQLYTFNVKDNGSGIKKENQDKIFELFHVAHNTDRSGSKGCGIGLATVKKLIVEQGGSITVESQLNIGTDFIFTIAK